MRRLALLLIALSAAAWAQAPKVATTQAAHTPDDTCTQCHSAMEGAIQKPALLIKDDVHTTAGLSCADCHGGDRTAVEPDVSRSKAKGFIGKPKHADIPQLCGKCHSDPGYMRRFRPRQRVDQLELYKTSVHGKKLAAGDMNAATCVDCHSVHDIRAVKDANTPTHPLNIPATCGRCHSDAARIPINQAEAYHQSVHWSAISKKGDLSAPNCVSCHGNHAIHQPNTKMLTGDKAICTPCHEAGTAGANAAAEFAKGLDGLDSALKNSEATLKQAEYYGMEVSASQMEWNDGHESLIKARLALHSFDTAKVKKEVDIGLAIAAKTKAVAEQALREKDQRRLGLAISALFIAITVAGIWMVIRKLERPA
jgi:hypothetical protein